MGAIEEYLGHVADFGRVKPDGFKYGTYEELLLERGTKWQWVKEDVELGEPQECFTNAALFAIANPEYRYCEGYACHPTLPIPIQHAWVINPDGNAVEVTWKYENGEYFGIDFETERMVEILLQTGFYGLLANDWRNGHKLLKNGL